MQTLEFSQQWELTFTLFKSAGPNKLGEYPIYLKLTVTLDGKTERGHKTTKKYVKESEWDADRRCVINRKDAKSINAALEVKLRTENARLVDMERKGIVITHKMLKPAKNEVSFYKFYRSVTGNRQMTKNNIVRISNYLYGDPVPYKYKRKYEDGECGRPLKEPRITDIDEAWLLGFENFLRDVHKYKDSSIRTAILDLQAALNHAERQKIIVRCPIHINGYRKPKKVDADFVYLTKTELQAFLELLDKRQEFSANRYKALVYFMFGCYTGLRQSDWRRFNPQKHIQSSDEGDDIVLRAQKNGTLVVMPIGPTLRRIIDIIKEIGPLDINYATVDYNLKALGKLLKINKTIKTHVGRHTCGYRFAVLKLSREVAAHYLAVTMDVINVYFHLAGEDIRSMSAVLRAA